MATKSSYPARKASATSGSKCLPRPAAMISRASPYDIARLYGRTVISASKTSAMAISLAETGIASPASPSG